MNMENIGTQLMYTTVPIFGLTGDKKQKSGTGFIFSFREPDGSSIPLLVTCYHVIEGIKQGIIEFSERDGDLPKPRGKVRVEFDDSILNVHRPLPDLDLIAIPLGPLLNSLSSQKKNVFFRSISMDLVPTKEETSGFGAIEDIVFIGYPIGLYDEINYSPLSRRGITATPIWNDFKGQSKFLIDAGVFPGSSGSPVFVLNQGAYPSGGALVVGSRVKFLGILTTAFLKDGTTPDVYVGIGEVLKSTQIISYLERLLTRLKDKQSEFGNIT